MSRTKEPLQWGQSLASSLSALSVEGPLGAFLRHSEREPIVDLATSLTAQLTERGEREAYRLGERLPAGRRLRLVHSPVGRCARTAERLAEGYAAAGGLVEGLEVDGRLYAPYVLDEAGLKPLMGGYTLEPFARAWFDGLFPAEVMLPLAQAAATQVEVMAERWQGAEDTDLILLVSHDWNMLLLREGILSLRHEDVGWPEFLDGPVFWGEGALRLSWGGCTAEILGDGGWSVVARGDMPCP